MSILIHVFFQEKGLAILSRVTVETVNGKTFVETIKYSKGTPSNPFSKEELQDKFKTLASALFREKRTEEIMAAVASLDQLDQISEVTKLLKAE